MIDNYAVVFKNVTQLLDHPFCNNAILQICITAATCIEWAYSVKRDIDIDVRIKVLLYRFWSTPCNTLVITLSLRFCCKFTRNSFQYFSETSSFWLMNY